MFAATPTCGAAAARAPIILFICFNQRRSGRGLILVILPCGFLTHLLLFLLVNLVEIREGWFTAVLELREGSQCDSPLQR